MVWSPLEQFGTFSISKIVISPLLYFPLSLTNVALYTIITTFLVLGLHLQGFNNFQIIPRRYTISLERAYASVHGLVKAQIGQKNEIYLPFIYSLFFFLLISNVNGNIPYGFTTTTSLIVSIGLSVTIFLGVTILAITRHRTHFFSFFLPQGTPLALVPLLVPIEVISYVSRAFSLGIRLFANIVSGHTLLKILGGFLYPIFTSSIIISVIAILPFVIFSGLVSLEIAVSFIQAYVFTILTRSYIKDALDLH